MSARTRTLTVSAAPTAFRVMAAVAVLVCGAGRAWAQSTTGVSPESPTLGFAEYYRAVRQFHPVTRQAQLGVDAASADVRGALGAFEPVLSASWDNKTFGGKRYWDEYAYKLIVPTPVGADIKLGYERAAGSNLNPEMVTPTGGLFSAGLSIPFGQRMLTDERRNALSLARAVRDLAEAERTAVLNKLLLTAAKDWASWFEAERRAQIATEGVALAEFRLGAVRNRVRNGDASAIDTVEAALEVERRTVSRLESDATAFTARLAAGAHLWNARGEPVELASNVRPVADSARWGATEVITLERALALAERAHPELAKLAAKLRQSAAQRTLAVQGVLPLVSLDVAAIAGGSASALEVSSDNAKAGLTAKVSPLLIKDRAKLSAATAKLERDRVEYERVRREVSIAVRDALNALAAVEEQLVRQARIVTQASRLRDGEQQRYDGGESSLLVVNLRERALLDEQLKLAALQAKRASARAALAVAVGDPGAIPL
jgi:outer membrane protein TolC